MQWRGRRESGNVEDRRSSGMGRPVRIGGLGVVGLLIGCWLFGVNPLQLLGLMTVGDSVRQETAYQPTAEDDSLAQFVKVVLADTEDVWGKMFEEKGMTYRMPTLVIYHGLTRSGCGTAAESTGPFYCPSDEKIYLDLSFYREMRDTYHAAGDFAFAYVLAHEVGHHVQKLLGTLDRENALQARSSEKQANAISVRIELQADFYAGVWANRSQKMFSSLEKGDIEEAIGAAAAVGDDRLQKQAQGYAVPDSFTHGTSEQRERWFMKGYESGNLSDGDTFSARSL